LPLRATASASPIATGKVMVTAVQMRLFLAAVATTGSLSIFT
jgi:hypothetical protein